MTTPLTPEEEAAALADLEPLFDALAEVNEFPCVECGESGDTLPCITCNKLICERCGAGCRFCKEHCPHDEIGYGVCLEPRHDGIGDDGRCGTCGRYLPLVCVDCQKQVNKEVSR